ncbi:nuclear transport factor 2 family protein [Paraglaciecola arctica]|uniref:SnoaL-like domain-containing protein n=1 Tax=Paraglaciecola arctica BSs20135 TaxID=493475 RepID=K6XM60_9ALTE|nr:nuclear transport factor 2 family protein [Paraglaciecola arctica]GAC21744.1 hypothetical protein GARC_4807 [Paraglaciecola arctica BSs20135]
MLQRYICLIFALLVQLSVQASKQASETQTQISLTLDDFHQAASDANQQQYFDLLSDKAVFIGTDATERWDKNTFKAFAKPYFDKGQGWTYIPRNRHVTLSASGQVAWFDELLDSQSYGECRGTGVLELTENGWKISQYHLTIPLPNGLAKDVVKQIQQQQH